MKIELIGIAILLASCAAGQELEQTPAAASNLIKTLQRWTIGLGYADLNVATALDLAGVPGGITEREPCGEPRRVGVASITEGLTLEQALLRLRQTNPRLGWHVTSGGVLRVDLAGDAPPILSLKIRHLRLDTRNLDLSINSLLQTEEVLAAAGRTGAEVIPPELGFSRLSKDGPIVPPPPDFIELSDASVEDVLNQIVKRNGRAVWEVSEHLCDAVHSIKFEWRVR